MLAIQETYITDNKGKRKQVVLNLKDYQKIQEDLEELAEIRAFDKVMTNFNREDIIPFEVAIKEIKVQK